MSDTGHQDASPLGVIGHWAREHREKIDEVRSWGSDLRFGDGDVREVARLLDAMQDRRPAFTEEAMDAMFASRNGRTKVSTVQKAPPESSWVDNGDEDDRRDGVDESELIDRVGENVLHEWKEDLAARGTTDAIREIYSYSDTFDVNDVVEKLAAHGIRATRNAVTTALSRGTGRYFERVDRGCTGSSSPPYPAAMRDRLRSTQRYFAPDR